MNALARQIVPLGAGIVIGSFAGSLLGLVAGIVAAILGGAAVALVLARVRRTRWTRRTYRVLLILHVLFWSAQGLTGTSFLVPARDLPTSDLDAPPRVSRSEVGEVAVGFAAAPFVLPERTTLGGWGMRPRRKALPAFGGLGPVGRWSQSLMAAPDGGAGPRVPMFHRPESGGGESGGDQLGARALVVRAGSAGPACLAVVRLDLIAVDAALVRRIRETIAHLDIPESALLVTATHTHSAPGGVLEERLAAVAGADHLDAEVREAVVGAAAVALAGAHAFARPARVAFASSRDRGDDGRPILGRDRCRGDEAPIDDRVLAMRFEDAEDGAPIGVLLNYAVQPVTSRPRHMRFTRDLAGALEDALSAALEGHPPVLFVNGALGNISPRPAPERGDAGARWLATRFAERIAPDIARAEPVTRLRVVSSRVERALPPPKTFLAIGSREAFHDHVLPSAIGEDGPGILANLICLPVNVFIWSLGLPEARVGFSFAGAAGVVVELDGLAPRTADVGAVLLTDEHDEALAVLLWQGGMPTAGVGRAWRRGIAARGLPTPYVLSLTNGALGYVTTEEEYDGRCRYEAESTIYGRDTGDVLGRFLGEAVSVFRHAP